MKTHSLLYHHRTQAKGAEGAHIRGMVGGFRQLGVQVDIVGPPGIDPYGTQIKRNVQVTASWIKRLLSIFADNAPQIFFELAELCYNVPDFFRFKKKYKENRPYDFIYERYALNFLSGAYLSSKMGIPFVLEVNDATLIERSRPLILNNIAQKNERYIFSQASFIITISNYLKSCIVKEYQVDAEKILVLPNAINPQDFCIKGTEKVNRSDLAIPENAIVLGCVGAFVPWHGLEFLVDVVSMLAVSNNLFMLFIGDGPVKDAVVKKAETYGISDRVLFTGFVDSENVPKFLDLVDICVIPGSNVHCSPMKLFEYMVMAKPIVLPKYQPLLETIQDGQEGLFFEPNDSSGLLSVLNKLIKSKILREEFGFNASQTVKSKYTWQKNCEKVLSKIVFSQEK